MIYSEKYIEVFSEKLNHSLKLIKKAEKLALNMSDKGFWLAFSGGKDSQCIYYLAKLANVKFETHYSLTTIDPPELVQFIKKEYKDCIIDKPKYTFAELIVKKKQLPLRQVRYCCSELKESMGVGFCTLIGIRKEESRNRSKRHEFEKIESNIKNKKIVFLDEMIESNFTCVKGKDKFITAPILEWSKIDVWYFLNEIVKVKHCSLYDEGYDRIGCIFCPMASKKAKRMDMERYPTYARLIKRQIKRIIENNGYANKYTKNENEIFDWWISNESMKSFFEKKKQLKLDI